MSDREPERVQSASRVLQLLGLLVERAPEPVRVTDAARSLGVSTTIAHRLLATMVSEGFATRLPNRTYVVGPSALRMASHWLEPRQEEALPYLERVADRAGETVHLLQLLGRDAVSIARVSSKRRAVLSIERDVAYPLWASAGGKAMLARLSNVDRVLLLPREPYPRFTPRTITRWSDLLRSIESGLFVERGELCPELACVAAPFPLPGRSDMLSIAISVPIERSDAELAELAHIMAGVVSG